MNDSITFKPVLVPVMIDIPVQGLGIYSQITHTQRFKNQSKRIEIGNQIFRTYAERCCGYRRIGKVSGIRRSYSCFRSQIGIPSLYIFYHENALECFYVCGNSIHIEGFTLIFNQIVSYGRIAHLCSLMTGIGPQQTMHTHRIPINSICLLNISLFHSRHIIECLVKSYFIIHVNRQRPSATACDESDFFQIQSRYSGYFKISLKETSKRDISGRFA